MFKRGDFFEAGELFSTWQAFVLVRWRGSDGLYYCDIFADSTDTTRRTGHRTFTDGDLAGMELCGGPTCRAEIERDRQARALAMQ